MGRSGSRNVAEPYVVMESDQKPIAKVIGDSGPRFNVAQANLDLEIYQQSSAPEDFVSSTRVTQASSTRLYSEHYKVDNELYTAYEPNHIEMNLAENYPLFISYL